jgi:hypothetical protein
MDEMKRTQARRWPRIRLHLRAIVSTTMVIGWLMAALSGLLPYYFLPRGPGSSGGELLGLGRSGWISMHLWLSVGMAAFTVAHVMLNQRGIARAFRVVSGTTLDPSGIPGDAARPAARKRVWAWAAVLASVAGLVFGGLSLAADSGAGAGTPGEGRARAERLVDDSIAVVDGTETTTGTG